MLSKWKCQEIALGYILSFCNVPAALRYAGYAESTIHKKGYQIWSRLEVKAALKEIRARIIYPTLKAAMDPNKEIDIAALLELRSDIYKKLNQRHRTFIDEYEKHDSASKAARIAGYSGKSYKQSGYQVLTNDCIGRYIDAGMEIAVSQTRQVINKSYKTRLGFTA